MTTIQKDKKGLDVMNLIKLFTEMKRNEDFDDISKDDKQNDRRHFKPIIEGKKPFTIGTVNHTSNFIEGFQELLDKIERLQSQKDEYINTKKKNIFLNEKLTEINDLIEATRHHKILHHSVIVGNNHLPPKQLEKEEHDKYNKVIKLSDILSKFREYEISCDTFKQKLQKEYEEKTNQLEKYHENSERNQHLSYIKKLELSVKSEKNIYENMKQELKGIIFDKNEEIKKLKEMCEDTYPIEKELKAKDEYNASIKKIKKKLEAEKEKDIERAEKDIKEKYENELKQLKKDKKELQLKLFHMEHKED